MRSVRGLAADHLDRIIASPLIRTALPVGPEARAVPSLLVRIPLRLCDHARLPHIERQARARRVVEPRARRIGFLKRSFTVGDLRPPVICHRRRSRRRRGVGCAIGRRPCGRAQQPQRVDRVIVDRVRQVEGDKHAVAVARGAQADLLGLQLVEGSVAQQVHPQQLQLRERDGESCPRGGVMGE